jgi:8-oxo-dGTP pyrophosphatase MutT (NUDIX family)
MILEWRPRITRGTGLGDPLFREHGRQVAALCWRSDPIPEVLLITSLNSRRWIFPKGWPEAGQTAAQSAAREAFEEAGVTGTVAAEPIGAYHYLKEKKDGGMPCRVDVFALQVTGQADDYPEKGQRSLAWMSLDQAAARVAEPGLREILRDHGKRLPLPAARRAG